MSFLGIYARTSIDREESTSIKQQIQLGLSLPRQNPVFVRKRTNIREIF